MEDVLGRILHDLSARLNGPLHLRFILQPAMSVFFAVRDGVLDARHGRSPWFWAVCTDPEHRRYLVQEGWKSVGKIFLVAIAIDVIYQIVAFHKFHWFEALLTASLLAFLPYVLLRGTINRIALHWFRGGRGSPLARRI